MDRDDRKMALIMNAVILAVVILCLIVGANNVYGQDSAVVVGAKLIRVVDGDTIRVSIAGVEEVIRVLGIDTPERGQDGYKEASAFTEQFLGLRVILVGECGAGALERDRFCRILAYVHDAGGNDLGVALLGAKMAVVFEKYPCGRTEFYREVMNGSFN